jgi:hypothetical protein
MDPTQCLIDILNSIDGCHGQDSQEAKARHREEAIEGLQNLAGWLQKGGFAPKLQEVLRLTRDHWADVELEQDQCEHQDCRVHLSGGTSSSRS